MELSPTKSEFGQTIRCVFPIIGADAFAEIQTWFYWQAAVPEFITVELIRSRGRIN